MLHSSTSVLTPSGFSTVGTVKVNDMLKTYFGSARIQKIDQETVDLMKVSAGQSEVMCSVDQEFLLKDDTGYVFDVPVLGSELVKYAVDSNSEDMLMTIQVVDSVTFWGKDTLYRIHLDDDFVAIITDYLVVRT